MNAHEHASPVASVRPRGRTVDLDPTEPCHDAVRLLVVSDQPVLRDAWASLLEAQGYHVAALAHDLSELLHVAPGAAPDAVVLDLPMDEVSARRTVAGLREQVGSHPTLLARWKRDGFLLCTGRGLPETVPHPGTHDLVALLDRALGGRHRSCEGSCNRGDRSERVADGCDPLTPRELEVLRQMAGGTTTNRDLARALEVSENTVKYHVRHILEKLQAKNRTQAVAIALRHRLIEVGAAQDRRAVGRR
ncbi:MAG TPA: response regulator transcription factor [Thermoanaerobaculia bacterium]|nr:response regulator transcription factor [Thermoanaerobaculia bacterium]